MKIEGSIETRAAPEAIFTLLSDPTEMPKYAKDVRSVHLEHGELETTGRRIYSILLQKGTVRRIDEIVDVHQPPSRYEGVIQMPMMTLSYAYVIETLDRDLDYRSSPERSVRVSWTIRTRFTPAFWIVSMYTLFMLPLLYRFFTARRMDSVMASLAEAARDMPARVRVAEEPPMEVAVEEPRPSEAFVEARKR